MKFYIKQKVFTFKDQFNITDENQNLKYQIKGKFMSITNKLDLMDPSGNVILHANRKVFTFMPKYFIYDKNNQEIAVIQKKLALVPKFNLQIRYKDMTVSGSLFAHSFVIYENEQPVASIQKKYISWGDTYEIEILREEDVELFLFVVIVLDQVIHEKKHNNF